METARFERGLRRHVRRQNDLAAARTRGFKKEAKRDAKRKRRASDSKPATALTPWAWLAKIAKTWEG